MSPNFGIWNLESGILNWNYSIFNILNSYSIFHIQSSIFLFILGLSVGSFLNVLIDRLPKGEKITGRSYCNHCKHKLSWQDLIPIISFLLLKGKCRYCGKNISWQYPLVEILTAVLFVFTFLKVGPFSKRSDLIVNLAIVSSLVVIFFSDLKYQIIPDIIQVVFFLFSLFLLIVGNDATTIYLLLLRRFVDGLLVLAPILFLFLVTRGRGMGFGDVKLSFTIGFLLGFKAGFLALYFGFVIGGIVGLILLLAKIKKLKSKIAFGPFLVLGIIIMLFWQKEIFEFVNKIYGF